jgi:hypothetical protein
MRIVTQVTWDCHLEEFSAPRLFTHRHRILEIVFEREREIVNVRDRRVRLSLFVPDSRRVITGGLKLLKINYIYIYIFYINHILPYMDENRDQFFYHNYVLEYGNNDKYWRGRGRGR